MLVELEYFMEQYLESGSEEYEEEWLNDEAGAEGKG